MKYSELNLDPRLNAAIEKLGYAELTPIQEQAIPLILKGNDVSGLAQTGTGKTAAFLIPLIEKILRTQEDPNHERAFKNWLPISQILIVCPTRELADQINDNVMKFIEGTGLKTFSLYGGTGYDKQKEALRSGLQFIVSTPGRLIDLYKENFVDLKQVRGVVFDEADRMFDMGFKDDMKYLLSRIPRDRQFLVFSATLNFDVLNTAYQFGAEPVEINVSRDQAKAENVQDFLIHLGNNEKPQQLLSLLKKENPKQAMIFTNFKHNVERLSKFLMDNNVPAMGISSLNSQAQRNMVIEKFKAENDQNILVATDVAARGLDIKGVDLVVNYELPQDAESYVHRIGRTGRAGREGKAYSLASDKDVDSLSRIEDYTKKKIEISYLEDADIIKDFKPLSHDDRPSYSDRFERKGSNGGGGRGGGHGGGDRKRSRPDGRGPRREFNKDSNDGRPPRQRGPHQDKRGGAEMATQPGQPGPQATHPRPDRKPQQKSFDNKNAGPASRPGQNQGSRPAHPKPAKNNQANGAAMAAKTETAAKAPTRNFRSNSSSKSSPGSKKSIGQKMKSLIKKIFG